MPVLRSSRFIRSIAESNSVFSRLRDRPGNHGQQRASVTPEQFSSTVPVLGLTNQVESEPIADDRREAPRHLGDEPRWAFANGNRCYAATPIIPDLENQLDDEPLNWPFVQPLVQPFVEAFDDDMFTPSARLATWRIDSPDDAIDAMELLRSPTFDSGLLVLVLDHERIPFLHVAIKGNPAEDLERALSLFVPALPNGRIPGGLVLGVIRPHHLEAPASVHESGITIQEPSIWVEPSESAAWRLAAWQLHDESIRLHDVIVIEPDRWMSLANSAGLVGYDTLEYA